MEGGRGRGREETSKDRIDKVKSNPRHATNAGRTNRVHVETKVLQPYITHLNWQSLLMMLEASCYA